MLCSHRLVANLRELQICAVTIDFAMLHSTVVQLTQLRSMHLHIDAFSPLSNAKWSSTVRMPRRSIYSIILHRTGRGWEAESKSKPKLKSTPQLLDVLLWFNECEFLRITETEGGQARISNLSRKDTSPNDNPQSKLIVRWFDLDVQDIQSFFESAFTEDMLDFRHLKRFTVRVFPAELDAMNQFLAKHGQALETLCFLVRSDLPSRWPRDIFWSDLGEYNDSLMLSESTS